MTQPDKSTIDNARTVMDVIRRVWGFPELRPLQHDAINAALDHRDALVVLPTGGGKSLCYQVPPLVTDELTVVISPLIALMKDQVDGLRLNGYPAVALHSACTPAEQDDAYAALNTGSARLLFVSPERLLSDGFTDWLAELPNPSGSPGPPGVRRFAIDEAHCISAWGHDFRPEYRQLATLRDRFPDACIHAFTATATERVREDITSQLGMRDPAILVGTFDRPNLIYRVVPRVDRDTQIAEVIARHTDGATIVYCISRKDTEAVADMLCDQDINASAYHAGLSPNRRRTVQEDFSREKLDVVVATVAFGMGIDRSNVRCVLHAALPKSIEAYQQETGRAGRDGLEAECVLLYSSADAVRWSRLFTMSAEESGSPPEVLQAQLDLLEGIQRLASGMSCRHKALSEHFDQPYPLPDCNACDVCLGENAAAPDATVIAQKIISCVARTIQHSGFGFGASHIVDILRGSRAAKILDRGHDQLSTYNLLRDIPKPTITSYINQLIDQDLLTRDPGKFATLALSPASRDVLTGAREVTLLQPKHPVERAPVAEEVTLSTDELDLFDSLRTLRRQLAEERGVPPYIIFSDDTLRELTAVRPASTTTMATVRGVGTQKLEAFSDAFIAHITAWCAEHDLTTDARPGTRRQPHTKGSRPLTKSRREAAERFARGEPIETIANDIKRTPRTVEQYLVEWIAANEPPSVEAWVPENTYSLVANVAQDIGMDFLKPIYERLNGTIPYDQVRIVVAHLRAQA